MRVLLSGLKYIDGKSLFPGGSNPLTRSKLNGILKLKSILSAKEIINRL
jgi:hypothetical protein